MAGSRLRRGLSRVTVIGIGIVLLVVARGTDSTKSGNRSSSGDTSGATAIAAMETQIGVARPLRITFTGSDHGGSLHYDVVTDGHGHVAGTYIRQGKSADLVISGSAIYMRGAAAATSFTQIATRSSGWLKLPAGFGPGMLGTLAHASVLEQCIKDSAGTLSEPVIRTVGGTQVFEFSRVGAPMWEFDVTVGAPHRLVRWQVAAGLHDEPISCNDGVVDYSSPRTGQSGIYTFTTPPVAPVITPPAEAVPLAEPTGYAPAPPKN